MRDQRCNELSTNVVQHSCTAPETLLTTEAVTRGSKLFHTSFLEGGDDFVEGWTSNDLVVFGKPAGQVKRARLCPRGKKAAE